MLFRVCSVLNPYDMAKPAFLLISLLIADTAWNEFPGADPGQ